GFHGDHGRGRIGKERQQLFSGDCFLDDDMLVLVDAADGEGILGEIDTETDNMGHGLLHFRDGFGWHLHTDTTPVPEWGGPCHSLAQCTNGYMSHATVVS